MIKREDTIKVTIGSFGASPKEVELDEETSVADALTEAGFSATAEAWVNGVKANRRDILEDGDTISVVTPKQAGNK